MVQMMLKENATYVKALGESDRIMISVKSLMGLIEDLKTKTGNSNENEMFVVIHGRGNEEMEIKIINP